MTKILQRFCFAVAVVFAAAPAVSMAIDPGAANGGAIVLSDSVSVKATIVDIKKLRSALRDEQGAEYVVIAGEEVRNFAQIKKGDLVEVSYHRAVATALDKASDATVAGQQTVQGPRVGIVTVKVPAEMKTFASLKKGDKISAVYNEAVAISVKSPVK